MRTGLPCTDEHLAVFIGIVDKLASENLGPGYARVIDETQNGFTIALTIPEFQVERALDHWTDLLGEAQRIKQMDEHFAEKSA